MRESVLSTTFPVLDFAFFYSVGGKCVHFKIYYSQIYFHIWFSLCLILGAIAVSILGPIIQLESDLAPIYITVCVCACYQVLNFCYVYFLMLFLSFCLGFKRF